MPCSATVDLAVWQTVFSLPINREWMAIQDQFEPAPLRGVHAACSPEQGRVRAHSKLSLSGLYIGLPVHAQSVPEGRYLHGYIDA